MMFRSLFSLSSIVFFLYLIGENVYDRSGLANAYDLKLRPSSAFRLQSKRSIGTRTALYFQRTPNPTSSSSSSSSPYSSSTTRLFVLDRLVRLVASNVNGLLKKMEDPEKIIEQAVTDMQNDLVKIRQSYAEVSATQKRFERQREAAESETDLWYRRAQTAMQKGDEALAKEALTRRKTQKEMVDSLSKQIVVQAQASEKLYNSMLTLEEKIVEAKRQKEALIARARTAKTSLQVNEMLNSLTTTSSSMEAFNRMKDKVDSLETQAEIAGEMAGIPNRSLEDKFKGFDGDDDMESELAQLRKQLPGKQSVSSSMSSPQKFDLPSDLDLEYEKLKREIRGL